MEILVLGGTRFFGVHIVENLVQNGHTVTVATRGNKKSTFQDKVSHIIVDHLNYEQMKQVFQGKKYDVVYDNIAYCPNDIKYTLDSINCEKYIFMSSTSVYDLKWDVKEDDFNSRDYNYKWTDRSQQNYKEGKRCAEAALTEHYADMKSTMVRYPFVIGRDDYTKRLFFYVEHVMKEIPMHIDNVNCQMGFISSEDAGRFLAFLADKHIIGAINGCSNGTISLREIINYIEKKTGKTAIINSDGEEAPYNSTGDYSINTNQAKEAGFIFTDLKEWIYDLLNYYIKIIN